MKQSNAPSTRFASRPALRPPKGGVSKGQALYGLVGAVLGVVVTLLVVLFCAALFAAIGRAAGYAPALARATTQPPAGPATPEGGSVEGRAVTVITATLDSSARFASGGVLSVTFDAAQIGGDILFEPPALQVADRELTATPESLKTARLAMLDAITEGKATATLTFDDVPPEVRRATLVFNPSSQPGNIVNPRIEAVVEWGE